MFFWIRTRTVTTGTVESRFPFHCTECGASTQAVVHSHGMGQATSAYGVGGTAGQASSEAALNARVNATSAIEHVLCLQCGAPQASVAARYAAIDATDEKKSERRLKLGTAAAIVVGLAGAYPAIRDVHESMTLPIAVGATALSAFGFVYALAGWPTTRPQVSAASVWLWWNRPDGTPDWVPAPTRFPPPRTDLRAAAYKYFFGGGLAAAVALVAGLLWLNTFEPVFVVQAPHVRIDGVPVAESDFAIHDYDDVPVLMHRVRKGKDHHVELLDADGAVRYEATLPKSDTYGWVVAPGASANGICFRESQVIYGGNDRAPESHRLGVDQPMFPLPRSYDDEFRSAPATQELKSGETKTRWTLRAFRCDRD